VTFKWGSSGFCGSILANNATKGQAISDKNPKRAGTGMGQIVLRFAFLFAVIASSLVVPSAALAESRGPVTNLPMPRFVSMKAVEGNVRRGPSLTHRVDWVFKREDMPLMIVAEYGHWRRVEDWEGEGGWMHYSLLSGVRTVVVSRNLVGLQDKPGQDAGVNAYVEAGVVARLGACKTHWCRIIASGYKGWVPKSAIWGVWDDELRE
jgi:SH3-like domain-containing protein